MKITLICFQFLFLCAAPLFSLSDSLTGRIQQLVHSNHGQLSVQEYSSVAQELLKQTPCNMLVFGVGKDSSLWIDLNKGGKVCFLEDNDNWLKRIQGEVPTLDAHLVHYATKLSDWQRLLEPTAKNSLFMNLPQQILDTKWDIIFVDGPLGRSAMAPGRMQSIFMASHLAHKNKNTHVFVHDCDRIVEATYSTVFLEDKNLVEKIRKLRHYCIP